MTLDGFCDHTAIDPDAEIHQHYTDLLDEGDAILYGRITYQLMEYWRPMLENPTGEKSMDDFARAIHKIPKIVFSHTLKNAGPQAMSWETARLANGTLEAELQALRQEPGKNIFVGSRSLIIQLLNLQLLDELQVCVHPVIAGQGLPLFENIRERHLLRLLKTKTFTSGAVIFFYAPGTEKDPRTVKTGDPG